MKHARSSKIISCVDMSVCFGMSAAVESAGDERVLINRVELERDFTASKRNKTLWKLMSSKMRESRTM